MAIVAGYVDHYFVKANKNDKEKNKKMWFYCLSLGKDSLGKRILHKKWGFETEKAAEKALRAVQVAADTGTFIKPSKILYGEYMFENRKSNLGRMTIQISNINN